MSAILFLLDLAITLYIWIIIAAVVMSWLIAFNVVNPYNQGVRAVRSFCERVTDPFLRRIRRFMPDLGGLDISPVIAILLLEALRIVVHRTAEGRLLS